MLLHEDASSTKFCRLFFPAHLQTVHLLVNTQTKSRLAQLEQERRLSADLYLRLQPESMWCQADAPTKDKLKLKDTHEDFKLKTKHKVVTKIKQEVQNPKHRVRDLPARHRESRITESRKMIRRTITGPDWKQ